MVVATGGRLALLDAGSVGGRRIGERRVVGLKRCRGAGTLIAALAIASKLDNVTRMDTAFTLSAFAKLGYRIADELCHHVEQVDDVGVLRRETCELLVGKCAALGSRKCAGIAHDVGVHDAVTNGGKTFHFAQAQRCLMEHVARELHAAFVLRLRRRKGHVQTCKGDRCR